MQIQALFNKYVELYPSDADDLHLLAEQLEQPDDITHRKNFVGHVTASAFIVNEHTKQVLLLEHKTLAKLLQPGGHIEPSDPSLLAATLREIEEETGLTSKDLTSRSVLSNSREVPFDIDTHYIPENPKKEEPGHYHHDFRYLYTTKTSNIKIDLDESNGYKWIEWDQFAESHQFMQIAERIEGLLEPNPRDFFRSIARGEGRAISVVAVSHIIPSSEAYISSLQENFNLIGIIPKPKSINKQTLKLLNKQGVTVLDQFTRENIVNDVGELAEYLSAYENICLVDIGGYFSEVLGELKKRLGKKLLGVVEDTENGHQKYENVSQDKVQVVSVARSPLKSFEDQLVGNGVAHAAETVLRELNAIITYKSCGIIGYGKIGKGVAQYLQQRGIKPYVCEIDPLRSIQASCDGAAICSIDSLLKKSDVVFCATGSRALDIMKLRDLKRGAFLASVTSSDDEFDLRFIGGEYAHNIVTGHITKYSKRGHHFYLLNDGNAINFLYSAAVDKYIYLVQGELMMSILRLAKNSTQKSLGRIQTNTSEDHKAIAELWLDYISRSEFGD